MKNHRLRLVGGSTLVVKAQDRDVAIFKAKKTGFKVAGQPS